MSCYRWRERRSGLLGRRTDLRGSLDQSGVGLGATPAKLLTQPYVLAKPVEPVPLLLTIAGVLAGIVTGLMLVLIYRRRSIGGS